MPYFFLILAWVAFGVIHSATASQTVKNWASQRMGRVFRYYRLFYNALAVITLLLLLALHRQVAGAPIWSAFPGQHFLAGFLTALGLGVVIKTLMLYDLREFLGLDAFQAIRRTEQMKQQGFLQYVRHPLYLGTIIVVLGLFLKKPSPSHLILLTGTVLYIRIGIYFEERKLLREFGDFYRAYQKKVPMLVPRWRSGASS